MEKNTPYDRERAGLEADVRKGVLRFALLDSVFILLVLLPGLLRLFVYGDDIPADRGQLYLILLLAGFVAYSGLLTWKFILAPARRLQSFMAKRPPPQR